MSAVYAFVGSILAMITTFGIVWGIMWCVVKIKPSSETDYLPMGMFIATVPLAGVLGFIAGAMIAMKRMRHSTEKAERARGFPVIPRAGK
jgi:TRAP-type C4-dicarboxylate transport system permease small subunit